MRLPRARALAALLVWGALGNSRPAEAYVRTTTEMGHTMRWSYPPVIDVELYTANPPPYLDEETLIAAVTSAAETWSRTKLNCTNLEISLHPVGEESAPVAYDSTNRITFRRDIWHKVPCDPTMDLCGLYDPNAIALTSVFARKRDGRILDSDMELNAVDFVWADVVRDGGDLTYMERRLHDLQNVLTHEFGHLIGLDHNCYVKDANPGGRPNDHLGTPVPNCSNAPASVRAATMFNSAAQRDVSKRDLSDDDIQAVCEVYPVGAVEDEEDSDGCAVGREPVRGRPAGGLTLTLFALGLMFGLRRRPQR
jgi:hypothetical protein